MCFRPTAACYEVLWWHIKQVIMAADYFDWASNIWWLSRPNLAKQAPVAHYGSSGMTGERGEGTVNSHLLCLGTFNWAFRSGIINMQLQSSRESAGELRTSLDVCLVCVSAWVYTGGSRLICVPWVNRSHSAPLCAVREETRGPSRHEITDYTLNASSRGLSRAKESKAETEWGGENKRCR